MLKMKVIAVLIFTMAVLMIGCKGTQPSQPELGVLAEVNGEKITVKDLYRIPMFNNLVKQAITEKIIKQEFKAREIKFDEALLQKEWDDFVEMQGKSEEAANEALKQQGMVKQDFMDSMTIKVMIQVIIEQDNPITLEDAKQEFEGNLEANQKMYSSFVPEKKDKPETITFDEVKDKVLENMKKRQFTQEVGKVVETLMNEYTEKGWIKNYVKPEEPGLTKIEKPSETKEIDPSMLKKAPIRRGKQTKEEEEKKEEKPSESGK